MTSVKTHNTRKASGPLKPLLAMAVAVGLLGVVGCSSSAGPAPDAPTSAVAPAQSAPAAASTAYHSPEGYSIKPPPGWVLRPTDLKSGLSSLFVAGRADTSAATPFTDNLNVVITPTTRSLADNVAETKRQYPGLLPHYQLVTDEPTVVNGLPAHLLGATFDDGRGGTLENLQLLIVNAGNEYTVTFTTPAPSFDTKHPIAQAALTSFTLG